MFYMRANKLSRHSIWRCFELIKLKSIAWTQTRTKLCVCLGFFFVVVEETRSDRDASLMSMMEKENRANINKITYKMAKYATRKPNNSDSNKKNWKKRSEKKIAEKNVCWALRSRKQSYEMYTLNIWSCSYWSWSKPLCVLKHESV